MRYEIVCHHPWSESEASSNRFGSYVSVESAQRTIDTIEREGLCCGPHEVQERSAA